MPFSTSNRESRALKAEGEARLSGCRIGGARSASFRLLGSGEGENGSRGEAALGCGVLTDCNRFRFRVTDRANRANLFIPAKYNRQNRQ